MSNPNPSKYEHRTDMKPPKGKQTGSHSLDIATDGVNGWAIDGQVYTMKANAIKKIEADKAAGVTRIWDFALPWWPGRKK